LVQDLLDIARIEAGQLAMTFGGLAVPELVNRLVEAQRFLAESVSVELQVTLEPGVSDVWGDGDRLLQVLTNLVGNALKFTPAGGVVTIAAAIDDSDVLFSVSDTGRGISPEDQSHLFERFWRGKGAGKGGAGLGLSIAKGIVEIHGGRLWLDRASSTGSTFCFSIPRRPCMQSQAHGSASE
jgi:signal transduction histidine kinase